MPGKSLRNHSSRINAHGQGGSTPPTGCEADGQTQSARKDTAATAANKQVSRHAGKLFRSHTSRINAHGQGGIYAADRLRSRRENEKTATGKCLHFSYGGSRFLMPVETVLPFPQAICGKTIFHEFNRLRIPGPGAMPLVRGAGPQRPCEGDRGNAPGAGCGGA